MKAKKTTTVLVVEDDAALNDAYQTILSSAGHTVLSALNGQVALDVIESQKQVPRVILLDLRMPVLDGVGFLKKFQPANHPETTVIVFSNYDSHKDIDTAYGLGVDRYVLKARVAPRDLLHLIDGVLSDDNQPDET